MAVSPTEQGRVGSGYGERTSSRTGRVTFHAGWDFVAPRHTPIYAADRGVVEQIYRDQSRGRMRGYGNAVVVRQDDDTWVLYAHLQDVLVRRDEQVSAGQQIGTSGSTTNGKFPRMPPHLHFEVRHARPDGSSPFPGPYGRLGLDPVDWFLRRGLEVGNRWRRPPGTLMPSGGVSGLGELSMEWWETVFPERAPEGETYEPAVDPVGSPIWDWSGLIAGALVFNVGYFVANRRLPILRLDQTPRGIPRNL